MKEANIFEAYWLDPDKPQDLLFTVIVPGDPDPRAIKKAMSLVLSGEICFVGGHGFAREVDLDEFTS